MGCLEYFIRNGTTTEVRKIENVRGFRYKTEKGKLITLADGQAYRQDSQWGDIDA